jgi:hypothetical protein
MRKYFTLLFLPFLLISFVSAQTHPDFHPQLGIGLHAGINRSNVNFVPTMRQEAVNLYAAGIIVNYISEPYLGLQLECNLSQKGWQESNDSTGSYSRTINYLEIPFLTHIYIPVKKALISFDLGPYIAFSQGFSEDYDPSLRANPVTDTLQLGVINFYGKEIDHPFDYGFMGGIAAGYNSPVGEFQIRFRYSQSLSNIFKKFPDGNFRYSQNSCFYVGVVYCYSITLKKK